MKNKPDASDLEKLRDYLFGDADEATAEEVRLALNQPTSPLATFVEQVAASTRRWLGHWSEQGKEVRKTAEEARDGEKPDRS